MAFKPVTKEGEEKGKKLWNGSLSFNEKAVLMALVEDCRASYTKISAIMPITKRAISKIRYKLDKSGVISGYSANLNHEIFGINVFAFMFMRKNYGNQELNNKFYEFVKRSPEIIGCYEVAEDSLYILLGGFRNLYELEGYLSSFQLRNKDLFEVSKVCITSNRGQIKNSASDLFKAVLV